MPEDIKDVGSDNGEPVPPEQPQGEQKPKALVLTITLHNDTGQLTVQGPGNGKMFDEPMCFWMLRKAERFIEVMNSRSMQSNIVAPNLPMSQQIRGMFNKHRRG